MLSDIFWYGTEIWDSAMQIVTCGNVPLETSFQKVPRCVYTSTGLYEYRGWSSKMTVNPDQKVFSWGSRFVEVLSQHYCFFFFLFFPSLDFYAHKPESWIFLICFLQGVYENFKL